MTAVDPYEGRRRINPQTGRIEVNMGGPMYNCFAPPCPQPEDNWQPDPDMPWEKKDVYGKWEYPNLRELAYPNEGTEDPKKNWKNITSILDGVFKQEIPNFAPIGTYDPNNPAKAEPIGTYDPRFSPQVVPLGKGW